MKKKTAKVSTEAKQVFGLHNLQVPKGAHKKRKYLGRGSSSGHGKTSTRGSKGETSRSGRATYTGFEGGQSPLIRRMPKRGFTSKFAKVYQVVNIDGLNGLKDKVVNPDVLLKAGLIKSRNKMVKILGEGELKNAVSVSAHAFSLSAQEKITKAGGKFEVLNA
ncbi:MAG: 50S ribosomal protein L15 [Candidatus Omnitrophica bacterium]|jgi:large subunit ribosomal protein L15|nr:50S ribosomal protein L15 [Candidatus Omnitrophota bacterium]MDD5079114.1 50S ribosomal protein L15 [Candidatus Omnitrophota bacterium]